MKKFCVSLICAISCVYYIESMEMIQQQPTNLGEQLYLGKQLDNKIDTLSEQLYNNNLTREAIEALVKQGANVNYKSPHKRFSVPVYFACNKTEQGTENMKTIIDFGAKLHGFDEDLTPLTIAVQRNNSPMIQLLLPFEKVEVSTSLEKRIREYIISCSFCDQNFESIKLLLSLKLMTANEGLDEFIEKGKPNQEILDYLITQGASNVNQALNRAIKKAFPCNLYPAIALHLAKRGAFDEESLGELCALEKIITQTREAVENNSQK